MSSIFPNEEKMPTSRTEFENSAQNLPLPTQKLGAFSPSHPHTPRHTTRITIFIIIIAQRLENSLSKTAVHTLLLLCLSQMTNAEIPAVFYEL